MMFPTLVTVGPGNGEPSQETPTAPIVDEPSMDQKVDKFHVSLLENIEYDPFFSYLSENDDETRTKLIGQYGEEKGTMIFKILSVAGHPRFSYDDAYFKSGQAEKDSEAVIFAVERGAIHGELKLYEIAAYNIRKGINTGLWSEEMEVFREPMAKNLDEIRKGVRALYEARRSHLMATSTPVPLLSAEERYKEMKRLEMTYGEDVIAPVRRFHEQKMQVNRLRLKYFVQNRDKLSEQAISDPISDMESKIDKGLRKVLRNHTDRTKFKQHFKISPSTQGEKDQLRPILDKDGHLPIQVTTSELSAKLETQLGILRDAPFGAMNSLWLPEGYTIGDLTNTEYEYLLADIALTHTSEVQLKHGVAMEEFLSEYEEQLRQRYTTQLGVPYGIYNRSVDFGLTRGGLDPSFNWETGDQVPFELQEHTVFPANSAFGPGGVRSEYFDRNQPTDRQEAKEFATTRLLNTLTRIQTIKEARDGLETRSHDPLVTALFSNVTDIPHMVSSIVNGDSDTDAMKEFHDEWVSKISYTVEQSIAQLHAETVSEVPSPTIQKLHRIMMRYQTLAFEDMEYSSDILQEEVDNGSMRAPMKRMFAERHALRRYVYDIIADNYMRYGEAEREEASDRMDVGGSLSPPKTKTNIPMAEEGKEDESIPEERAWYLQLLGLKSVKFASPSQVGNRFSIAVGAVLANMGISWLVGASAPQWFVGLFTSSMNLYQEKNRLFQDIDLLNTLQENRLSHKALVNTLFKDINQLIQKTPADFKKVNEFFTHLKDVWLVTIQDSVGVLADIFVNWAAVRHQLDGIEDYIQSSNGGPPELGFDDEEDIEKPTALEGGQTWTQEEGMMRDKTTQTLDGLSRIRQISPDDDRELNDSLFDMREKTRDLMSRNEISKADALLIKNTMNQTAESIIPRERIAQQLKNFYNLSVSSRGIVPGEGDNTIDVKETQEEGSISQLFENQSMQLDNITKILHKTPENVGDDLFNQWENQLTKVKNTMGELKDKYSELTKARFKFLENHLKIYNENEKAKYVESLRKTLEEERQISLTNAYYRRADSDEQSAASIIIGATDDLDMNAVSDEINLNGEETSRQGRRLIQTVFFYIGQYNKESEEIETNQTLGQYVRDNVRKNLTTSDPVALTAIVDDMLDLYGEKTTLKEGPPTFDVVNDRSGTRGSEIEQTRVPDSTAREEDRPDKQSPIRLKETGNITYVNIVPREDLDKEGLRRVIGYQKYLSNPDTTYAGLVKSVQQSQDRAFYQYGREWADTMLERQTSASIQSSILLGVGGLATRHLISNFEASVNKKQRRGVEESDEDKLRRRELHHELNLLSMASTGNNRLQRIATAPRVPGLWGFIRAAGIKISATMGDFGISPVNTLLSIFADIEEEEQDLWISNKWLDLISATGYTLYFFGVLDSLVERLGMQTLSSYITESGTWATMLAGLVGAALSGVALWKGGASLLRYPVRLAMGPGLFYGARLFFAYNAGDMDASREIVAAQLFSKAAIPVFNYLFEKTATYVYDKYAFDQESTITQLRITTKLNIYRDLFTEIFKKLRAGQIDDVARLIAPQLAKNPDSTEYQQLKQQIGKVELQTSWDLGSRIFYIGVVLAGKLAFMTTAQAIVLGKAKAWVENRSQTFDSVDEKDTPKNIEETTISQVRSHTDVNEKTMQAFDGNQTLERAQEILQDRKSS